MPRKKKTQVEIRLLGGLRLFGAPSPPPIFESLRAGARLTR